jgi:hypothetical protein
LTSITIPEKVTAIINSAFYGCSGLTCVVSLIKEPFEIEEIAFIKDGWGKFTSATLYIPKGTKEKYEAAPAWNKFQNIVEMDEIPTYVENVTSHSRKESTMSEFYSIGGRRQNASQRGLNIIRMSDGTVRKVMVK